MGDEENGDITQGQPVEQNDTGTSNEGEPTGGHPAWKEILDQLPDEFHPLITPKLEAWDQGVQTKFQSLQSQYEPYKQFVEQDVDPDFLSQAIGLAAAIEQDPQRVYNALAEAYGYGQGAAVTPETDTDDDDDDTNDPILQRLAEQERMMEQMAETFLADQNVKEETEYANALDSYMEALHEAYDPTGGFDDNYVLTQLSQGVDGEVAINNFREIVKNFGGNGTAQAQGSAGQGAPPVLGSGGGMPSQQVDVSKLGDADTQRLVSEMLRAANES